MNNKGNVQRVINYMESHPWAKKQGAKLLARKIHVDPSAVYTARAIMNNKLDKEEGKNKKVPKILIFDIETSPMKAYVWKRWRENISLPQTISEWFVICWSAKWLYSNEVMGDVLTKEEVLAEDDSRVVESLWKLFDGADIVVAHNGNNFDIPKMNSRFIINGLNPPTPFFSVDTCLVAKKQFGFSSNKLDALATYFGFDHKLDTSFELWKSCMEGDEEALEYMLKYNKRDVTLLEEVYLRLLPWIKNHPNINNILGNSTICCSCGSSNIKMLEDKYYYTSVGKYHLFRCECGCLSRGRVNLNKDSIKKINTLR